MKYIQIEKIDNPQVIKRLSLNELNFLASEIRHRIIEVLSINGGHLASNLGVVELTIALHRVFDSPKDKFIWDTSHQTYVHKLLTGRKDRFETINQVEGLCGFSDPRESEHDHFFAGHAGTAMSLAVGVSKKRDLTGGDEFIVPIIGDAALTCGLTYEALNNLSRKLNRFIVIVNDNQMSISENVGRITHTLSRLLNNPTSHRLHQELDTLVCKIPSLGDLLAKQGHKITESIRNLVSPAAFFEHFGVSYIGPVDGHDMKKLIDVFEGIKCSNSPVLVHVLTNKGLGHYEAEQNPTSYHGAKPFDKVTGKFLPSSTSRPSFPKIFGEEVLKMAEEDPSIVAVTPAMSAGSCLDPFMKKYPERCVDVGIAESHCVTYAGGIAHGKAMKVIACVYATFLQRALDNLFHDVCLQQLPVLFALDRAGLAPYGPTHHGIYDIGFLKGMPNLIIAQPRDGQVFKELLHSAFDWEQPKAIRYPNQATEAPCDTSLKVRRPGQGEVLARGKRLLLIGLGEMNQTALAVRELLLRDGIESTVFDPVFIKPLDQESLCNLLSDHDHVATIEEHALSSGLGSIINHFIVSNSFRNHRVHNFGIPDTFVEHGAHGTLLNKLGLQPDQIAKAILQRFTELAKEKVLV